MPVVLPLSLVDSCSTLSGILHQVFPAPVG